MARLFAGYHQGCGLYSHFQFEISFYDTSLCLYTIEALLL